ACSAPVGAGLLTITGETGLPGRHRYALALTAQDMPASAIGALARRAKKELPEDLSLEGTLRGKFSISENADSGAKSKMEGHGEIEGLRVSSASDKVELGPVTIPIALTGSTASAPRNRSPQHAQLELGPFTIERAHPGAAVVHGWVDRAGYGFTVLGDAEVGRTLRVART